MTQIFRIGWAILRAVFQYRRNLQAVIPACFTPNSYTGIYVLLLGCNTKLIFQENPFQEAERQAEERRQQRRRRRGVSRHVECGPEGYQRLAESSEEEEEEEEEEEDHHNENQEQQQEGMEKDEDCMKSARRAAGETGTVYTVP